MRLVVVGTGHVGLVTAAVFAKLGHQVAGLDDDREKIETLRRGEAPFFEPGLKELLDELAGGDRLVFTHDPAEAVTGAEVAFICVGTPASADGEANLRAVESAAVSIARHATGDIVVVQKSTVPVHTGDRLKKVFSRLTEHRVRLVSNPEFLREGSAVADSLRPDRILVGAEDEVAHDIMRRVYEPLISEGVRYFATDVPTAELAKHACNAFLATKISFANALAAVCEAAGADVTAVADIMGADERIGRAFLNAGLGYGGYCFPKDLAAFKAQALKLGYDFGLLDEVIRINAEAVDRTFDKVKEAVWNLEGKRIALFGLSFKPDTDDVRESPSLFLARRLVDAGAQVVGHDPQANEQAKLEVPQLQVFDDPYAAAEGADCIVIATDWQQFRSLDLPRLKGIMTHPIIVDARNLLDPEAVAGEGFTYIPTGRPPINL